MELRCYSYDGGAPPMDSWPLEEKMGVVKLGFSPGFNQSYQATTGWFALGWFELVCF